MGPEGLRVTKQAKVSTELQEGQGEARAAPGTALSGSWGSKAIRNHSLFHSFIHSTNIY